ncbi:MAG: hypothetical protein IPG93_02665 [Burkholderiales bacterium]|nr:hypothetical protein [Burkholderiales bacterium]
MSDADIAAADALRAKLALELPAGCRDDFQRLTRSLLHGPRFQWLLVEAPNDLLRAQVLHAIEQVLHAATLGSARLALDAQLLDVPELEAALIARSGTCEVVHVLGRRGWFDRKRWDAFNVRRERIASQARAKLIFWLDTEAIEAISVSAPDLWAWRTGVYSFLSPAESGTRAPDAATSTSRVISYQTDLRSVEERRQRIDEIESWLRTHLGLDEEALVLPYDELGRLLHSLGNYGAALIHLRDRELPLHERRGDDRAIAITKDKIADILQARGQLDEALRIRQDDELPVYERLGDVRSAAVTKGKIADILQARGQLDEALRIHQDDELPVFERLGDVREAAITKGRIADILQARGQLDEALHIRQDDELPVYERLGDVRSAAVTKGQIADILQARGQLDEALRIRQDDQLPVYERLGDVREAAVTKGQIADILQARGQLDEALRIRQDDQLPVYERLGDVRAAAVTKAKIALLLFAQSDSQTEAEALLRSALHDLRRLGLPEADAVAKLMATRGLPPDATTKPAE